MEVIKRIEAEVLAPYEEHKANLKEYTEVLIEALEQEFPLSEVTREELKDFQQVLGLTDEDVAGIEASIVSQIPTKCDDLSSEKNVDYTRLRQSFFINEIDCLPADRAKHSGTNF